MPPVAIIVIIPLILRRRTLGLPLTKKLSAVGLFGCAGGQNEQERENGRDSTEAHECVVDGFAGKGKKSSLSARFWPARQPLLIVSPSTQTLELSVLSTINRTWQSVMLGLGFCDQGDK